MQKANQEFRADMKAAGIRLWQIANEIGVSEATITRLLRVEVNDETRMQLTQAAQRIKERSEK